MKRVDPKQSKYLRLMPYGQPGSYKTRFAASAALYEPTSPVLMLNMGGNPLSILDYPQVPDILDVEKLADLKMVYDWLAGGMRQNSPLVQQFGLRHDYRTFVLDGITGTQRQAFNELQGIKDTVGDVNIPDREFRHYNKVLSLMVNMARLCFQLPMHVIITAQEQEKTDASSGLTKYRPLLDGQSQAEVPGWAYTVMRMAHRSAVSAKLQKEYGIEDKELKVDSVGVAFLKPTRNYYAKDQHGMGVDFIVEPTVEKVYNLAFRPRGVLQDER